MRLAVIPARGGSKRIPRKNIKSFGGLPIIAWSINAALQSRCFDRIIVSTDDDEIAQVAQTYGAEAPFVRPPELSDDHIGTVPVISHAIAWQNANGQQVNEACCIYATAPFVQPQDLQRGLRILQRSDCDYAFAVASFVFPIQRAVRITPKQRIEMFQPEYFSARSQDLEEAWHDAGQFYWGKSNAWLAMKPVFCSNAAPVILPRYRVQDIDTPEDWERAELLFRVMQINTDTSRDHDWN
jgi:pseudaminic acid cytidylyltransferase